ncbi:alpha/beta hydrolase [Dactylosporangium sp. NPDC005555]|uniref:alpha/beta fold hydrolase n=1 Tax=Dactylosporangium sp. NPDC005555 TaxID=3154889 RepID=UPI0033AD4927
MGTVVFPSTVRLADGACLYSVLYPPAPAPATGAADAPATVPAIVPGRGGAAQTPVTVVFLHGWTLDNRLWRQQIADLPARVAALVRRPVRMVAFDLRGHGRSSATSGTDATLEQLGDDLAEVMTQLVPDGPVILVGHSLGGMAIMEYAQRHAAAFATRVVGVVLVSTSAEGSSRTSYGLSPRLARVMRILEVQGAGLLARSGAWRPHRRLMPLLSPGVRWLVFGGRVDTSWVALTASMVGNAPLCAIGGFRPSVDLHHRVETLAAMRGLPVAVLVGTLDRLTPPACAATIAGELPDAELITCDDAGHMLPIERPDMVTDAIVNVIRRAARTTRMARQRTRSTTPTTRSTTTTPTVKGPAEKSSTAESPTTESPTARSVGSNPIGSNPIASNPAARSIATGPAARSTTTGPATSHGTQPGTVAHASASRRRATPAAGTSRGATPSTSNAERRDAKSRDVEHRDVEHRDAKRLSEYDVRRSVGPTG